MKRPYWYLKKSKDGQFYFILKAINGETLLTSEMYTTKDNAKNGIKAIRSNGAEAEIKDLT